MDRFTHDAANILTWYSNIIEHRHATPESLLQTEKSFETHVPCQGIDQPTMANQSPRWLLYNKLRTQGSFKAAYVSLILFQGSFQYKVVQSSFLVPFMHAGWFSLPNQTASLGFYLPTITTLNYINHDLNLKMRITFLMT